MQEINRRYAHRPEHAKLKNGEIFPADTAPVIALADQRPQAYLFTWGLPQWKGSGVLINARSETVGEKPMFRQAFASRRCIIPATGFYEWKKEADKKKKDKYLFRSPDSPLLYMAGIYTVFEKAGIQTPGFLILTTTANSYVQSVHGRMPVLIAKDEQTAWLQDASFARHILNREGPQLEAGLV